jgi:hypothetical protein
LNSKIKTYLLLTGVLIVWGLIAYMIITGIHSDEPQMPKHQSLVFSPVPVKDVDTFSIKSVQRDPFLGTLKGSIKDDKKTPKKTDQNSTDNKLEIIYKGLIQKQNSSDQVFAVVIENKEYLLKKGQTIDDIKLISGTGQSIKVIYNQTYQTIKRQ